MSNRFLYLSEADVNTIIKNDYELIIGSVKNALKMLHNGSAIQPDKISQIFDSTYQNRINCMPSTLKEIDTCGMKWVSVFPSNQNKNIKNVEGVALLSELETGGIKCFMNASELTSLRTAAVGALASKYLAKSNPKALGFIGAGEEALAHFRLIKYIHPTITQCYISSRSNEKINNFIKKFSNEYPDTNFIHCENDYQKAVESSDIIVTAISSQEPVLKANWIKSGALYIHVAGLEDEFAVAKKASKIVCDKWECVKHRTQTIAQMYKNGQLKDCDIYADLAEIIIGDKKGRTSEDEFIYFNSVGLAAEDVMLCNNVYNKAVQSSIGIWLNK